MNQYSVLLVDDEEDVFQVIMKKLDWEDMGFRIAGYARNGVEALEMFEELQPDVVMTDIKMPYMDGLTLCKKLKESDSKVKVIIFSGFDEFEYAKEAIKIEAEEYILKPINSGELREVFERIKGNLDRELDEKQNIDKLRSYYMESLPVLQESVYTSLLEGRLQDRQIRQYLKNYQIDLTGPYYVVTVLHISTSQPEDVPLDPFLMAISVKRTAEEQVQEKWRSKTATYLGEILLISQLEHPEDITIYTDEMNSLCRTMKRVCKAKVTAGIGHVCDQLSQLQLSYQGARNAVSYRVIYGNSRAINIAETDPQENADPQWEEPYIDQIMKQIKMGSRESLKEAISEFCIQLKKQKISLQRYNILIMELIAELFRFGNDNQLNMERVFGSNNDIYSQALQLETAEAVGDWMENYGQKLQGLVEHERRDSTISFVDKAIEYVQEHYADQDLNIESICNYLNVSAAYFSTIFKKETGKTFINYLTEYRMQQAVELLIGKGEKTYIIAEKVGYSDPNYFSYVFKKQFGMSPSKYKQKEKGEA